MNEELPSSLNTYQVPQDSPLVAVPPKSSPKFGKIFGLSLLFVLIIFLIAGGIAVGAAYNPATFSFVPASTRQDINRFLLDLPVPRNLEQIMIGSKSSTTSLQQYNQSLFFEIGTTGVPITSPLAAKAAFRLDGPIDTSDITNPQFDQTFSVLMGFGGENMDQIQGEVLVKDLTAYIRFDSLPNELIELAGGLITQDMIGKWVHLDAKELGFDPEMIRGAFDNAISQSGESDEDFQQFLDELEMYITNLNYYDYLELVGTESVDGVDAYHIQLSKSGDEVVPLASDFIDWGNEILPKIDPSIEKITDLQKDSFIEALSYVDNISIDVWFKSDDFMMIRNSFSVTITPPLDLVPELSDLSDMYGINVSTDLKLELSWGWEATNINVPQDIAAPQSSESLVPYVTDLMYNTPNPLSLDSGSEDTIVKADIDAIADALEQYYNVNNSYPETLDALAPIFISEIPGRDYGYDSYEYYSNGTRAVIFGTLTAPADYTKPFWMYDTATKSTEDATFENYFNIIDEIGSFPAVQGAFDTDGTQSNIYELLLDYLKDVVKL